MAPTECPRSACLLPCLISCLHACLLACLLTCFLALLACLLACLLSCLLACLLACLPQPILGASDLSGLLLKLSRATFQCSFAKRDGRTHGHTHDISSSRAPVGANNWITKTGNHTDTRYWAFWQNPPDITFVNMKSTLGSCRILTNIFCIVLFKQEWHRTIHFSDNILV